MRFKKNRWKFLQSGQRALIQMIRHLTRRPGTHPEKPWDRTMIPYPFPKQSINK